MYGRVNVTFFPYVFGGKKGIGCGLGPVQKLEDGEPLGGSAPTAAQAFGAPQPAAPAYGTQQRGQMPAGNAVNPITGLPV